MAIYFQIVFSVAVLACFLSAKVNSECTFRGKLYNTGESFAWDCNQCSCEGNQVSCSLNICKKREKTEQRDLHKRGRSCTLHGKTFSDGDEFASSDGCNLCFCSNGNIGCTLSDCKKRILLTQFTKRSAKCKISGKTYNDGESFLSNDGCNKCFCSGGSVGCTMMDCKKRNQADKRSDLEKAEKRGTKCQIDGITYSDGQNFYLANGCNKCVCNNGAIACVMADCKKRNHNEVDKRNIGCSYKGNYYEDNEDFEDNCNSCFCTNGNVVCTRMMCQLSQKNMRSITCEYNGDVYNHLEEFDNVDGCNSCTCINGEVVCTMKEC